MKKTILMDSSLYNFHSFSKENLISHNDGSDTYVCLDCGIKGNRAFLSPELFFSRVSKIKLTKCDGSKGTFELIKKVEVKIETTDKKVKVIQDAHLAPFNVNKGDILEVIKCPDGEKTVNGGVWVKNETTPQFMLLDYEYEEV